MLGTLRADTIMYYIVYETHIEKSRRPRKNGQRINYRNLDYSKDRKYFVAHTQEKDKVVHNSYKCRFLHYIITE